VTHDCRSQRVHLLQPRPLKGGARQIYIPFGIIEASWTDQPPAATGGAELRLVAKPAGEVLYVKMCECHQLYIGDHIQAVCKDDVLFAVNSVCKPRSTPTRVE
jgi:hypothetical protein